MYTIKMQCHGLINSSSQAVGLLEYTLGEDLKWWLACGRPVGFQSLDQARRFAEQHKIVENRPRLGTDAETLPFISRKGKRFSVSSKNKPK